MLSQFQVIITADVMMNFRIPILLYFGYCLYSPSFFKQLPYIVLYAIVGKIINIAMSTLLTKFSLELLLKFEITYSQTIIFCCVSNIVEPLNAFTFFKETSANNFFLLLGAFIIGNATAFDVFNAFVKIAHLPKHVDVPELTYFCLALKPVWDGVFGSLIGALVGIFVATIIRLNDKERVGENYEIGLIVASSCFVYFLSSFLRLSTMFAVLSCCLVQERYLFTNLSVNSVLAVKTILGAMSYCIELLFYIFIGYKFMSVDFKQVYQYALIALVASYLTKSIMIIVTSLIINLWKKSKIKTQMQGLLIFGGIRGARSYPLLVGYLGPFSRTFQDMLLIIIVFSVLVDGIISNVLVIVLRRWLYNPSVEDREIHMVPWVMERKTNSCVEWLRKKELILYNLFKVED